MEHKDDDNGMLLDQAALEAMHAIENKDKEAFKDAFEVLVTDILSRLSESMETEGE